MYKERLLKLADHLESGNLKFDFRVYCNYDTGCGCALGETTYIFDGWKLGDFGAPLIGGMDVEDSAMFFYGLSSGEVNALFYPYEFIYEEEEAHEVIQEYGLEKLTEEATAEEVAANIRKFVNRRNDHEQREIA